VGIHFHFHHFYRRCFCPRRWTKGYGCWGCHIWLHNLQVGETKKWCSFVDFLIFVANRFHLLLLLLLLLSAVLLREANVVVEPAFCAEILFSLKQKYMKVFVDLNYNQNIERIFEILGFDLFLYAFGRVNRKMWRL
jgi:hypothetical protein